MKSKEIHYFDKDTEQFVRVRYSLDVNSADMRNFSNWIYSLKLDSKLSAQENFRSGVSTADINRFFKELFSDKSNIISFVPLCGLFSEDGLAHNPRFFSIMNRFMDFFIVNDVCSYSKDDYFNLLQKDFWYRQGDTAATIVRSIPDNTKVLKIIGYDPKERLEQDKIFDSSSYAYQLVKTVS